jgi:dipeptidyl aminopeptidase/acylaminoacyl peptidase
MFMQSKWRHVAALFIAMAASLLMTFAAKPQSPSVTAKRPIAVVDAIEMTRLEAPDYFRGRSSTGLVANFSPDGMRFVVLLRKGDLEHDTNDVSLLLFETAGVFHSATPDTLLKMSSTSNRSAITGIRWFPDNETLVFLGENPRETAQIYTLNVRTKLLKKLTSHPTAITTFDVSNDSREILFAAEPARVKEEKTDETRRDGIVIATALLEQALLGDPFGDDQLFLQTAGKQPVPIPVSDRINYTGPISISPTGRYALIGVWARDVPAAWTGYRDKQIHAIAASHRKGELALLKRYLLLNLENLAVTPLLDAPTLNFREFVWRQDGQAVILKSYLPLEVVDPIEREMRAKEEMTVEVKLSTRELQKITREKWESEIGRVSEKHAGVNATLEEDMNTAPRIYANDPKGKRKELLLDLNPQFSELEFGKVETISWKASDGKERGGGLFLPPNYEQGRRYPLVIQTHGFDSERFSMDGANEWSSAFAARMLAAKGFVVLQVGGVHVSGDTGEGPAYMAAIEGVIDDLDRKGVIDRNRVGISGFSRTVYEVGYTLTHTKYKFGAAILVDGITGGYLDYLAWGDDSEAMLNGASPFGSGLELWLKNSPCFNLDKVATPVRIVAHGKGSVLEMWEWYAGLKLQGKPVDFIEIPDGVHLLQKPGDRRIAIQGIVDWFSFWLKQEEDLDPAKASQYDRWRALQQGHSPV